MENVLSLEGFKSMSRWRSSNDSSCKGVICKRDNLITLNVIGIELCNQLFLLGCFVNNGERDMTNEVRGRDGVKGLKMFLNHVLSKFHKI